MCFMYDISLTLASLYSSSHQKFNRKNGISNALTKSMRKAQTKGTIMNARCEAPLRLATADMFAMAVLYLGNYTDVKMLPDSIRFS